MRLRETMSQTGWEFLSSAVIFLLGVVLTLGTVLIWNQVWPKDTPAIMTDDSVINGIKEIEEGSAEWTQTSPDSWEVDVGIPAGGMIQIWPPPIPDDYVSGCCFHGERPLLFVEGNEMASVGPASSLEECEQAGGVWISYHPSNDAPCSTTALFH